MAYVGKNELKYVPSDWHNALHIESTASVKTQAISHELRQEGRTLWQAADVKTKWDEYRNTARLAKRTQELKNWVELLENIHERLNEEIDKAQKAKYVVDGLIARLFDRLAQVTNILSIREARKEIDYVQDKAEYEMQKFQKIIITSRDLLQNKSDKLYAQILSLKEVRQQVAADLQDKGLAMDIDLKQYHLQSDDPKVSYKPNCMRIPKGTISPEQWAAFSQSNYDRALREIAKSNQLRSIVHAAINTVENDLDSQRESAKLALRNRAHEFQQALDELCYQKELVENEIAAMENELDRLEKSLVAKIPMTKLVQTRLENRTYRPGMDLVFDKPQRSLLAENISLDETQKALQKKQHELRHGLHQLYRQLNRLKDDIKLKTESLALDNETIEILGKSEHDTFIAPTTNGHDFDHIVG
ncbi:tektin 2 (testicular) [Cichlidogyrus casuarinus]|uniref:Tektin n=1 Tax=Cichlidogyrus casuarinus TaxID=1844966 RepID=A0ABD2PTT8_9PLAT